MDFQAIPSPAFVLDEALLHRNLRLINRVQEAAGVDIILAFKGFAMWSTFPLVRKYLKGATASSLFEARLCVEEMGVKAHSYAPAYHPQDFEELLKLSSHISFNSLSEFERYRPIIAASEEPVSCGLRVNPEYSDVATALYNPAARGSRLGVTQEQLAHGLPHSEAAGAVGIEGLHFHTLCESDSYALEKTLQAFEDRFGHLLPQIKWVNMGGGHLMTRADYEVDHLIRLLRHFSEKHKLSIILEPGSAIAWETGILLTTILDIVDNHGVQTAIIDASFTAHMPDTLEMPYRPRIRGASEKGQHQYRIGGVSCLAGDFMEAYAFDAPLRVGQHLIFEDMIHYTMVKTTMFNGVKHPDIAIWKEEGQLQLVRQFDYPDFKRRLS